MRTEEPTQLRKLRRKMSVKVGASYNRFKGGTFVAIPFVSLCCGVLANRPPL